MDINFEDAFSDMLYMDFICSHLILFLAFSQYFHNWTGNRSVYFPFMLIVDLLFNYLFFNSILSFMCSSSLHDVLIYIYIYILCLLCCGVH